MTHSHSILSRAQLGLAFGLAMLLAAPALMAQAIGTAFTYQGELRDAGSPASASYDFEFRLFDAAEAGGQIGPTVSLPSVAVADGLFNVELDFGPGQFVGDAQWLDVAVRPAGGGDFELLVPRTKVTAAPYALAALTALDGSVSSASIASGAVGTSQINSNQVQRRVSGSCPEGQYLRAVAQDGAVTCGSDATGSDWSRGGNAGTDASVDFLGTTDAQALEIRTANVRSLRLEPSDMLFNGLPTTANVVAGSHANAVDAGVRGGTIAGGGAEVDMEFDELGANEVRGDYGSVGGGFRNRAGDALSASGGRFATVAGGGWNLAPARASAVSGGTYNAATGLGANVAGGQNSWAAGEVSVIGGGFSNLAGGLGAAVGGGSYNSAPAEHSAVSGGYGNCAGGAYSWAGGRRALVRFGPDPGAFDLICGSATSSGDADGDNGTFVWADSQNADFVSTGPNQFLVRAAGGVALNDNAVPNNIDLVVNSRTNGANADLMLRPKTSSIGVNFGASSGGTLFIAKATITANSPAFTNYAQWNDDGVFRLFVDNPIKPTAGGFAAPSDARLKQHIRPLGNVLDQLLALRGVRFQYRDDAPDGLHAPGLQVGFIAQEVEAVFPDWVIEHDSGYKLVAPKGFDALAVEALRELRIEKDVQIEALQTELAELRALVKKLAAADAEAKESTQ